MTLTAPLLRLLDLERDGEALHAIFGDEDSCRYMARPPAASADETAALLKAWTAGCEETSWAVVGRIDGPALGRIAMIPHSRDIWEAACMIVPAARGRNLAELALRVAVNHMFEQRGAFRIFADVDPDNAASLRTFERLGFVREGVLRGNWKTHIGVRDSVIFGLLRTDARSWRTALSESAPSA